MAIFSLLAGLQQQFAPFSFYENFPGFGLTWVSVDGPYNEHLLRDLGGANLALAVVAFYAIFRPTSGLVRTVAAVVLIAQIPHFVYHAFHLGLLATPLDRVLQTVSLAVNVLVPALVFALAGRIDDMMPEATVSSLNRQEKAPSLVAAPR